MLDSLRNIQIFISMPEYSGLAQRDTNIKLIEKRIKEEKLLFSLSLILRWKEGSDSGHVHIQDEDKSIRNHDQEIKGISQPVCLTLNSTYNPAFKMKTNRYETIALSD